MKQTSLSQQDRLMLALALIIAILHGVVYTFLMPPWQHYDEPNHFEYVWLAAKLDHPPAPTDYNPKMSRQVLKSMLAHGFFDHLSYKPVVGPPVEKVKIPGYSQLSEQPLYYWLASVPLRLFPSRGINAQLYAARLVSLLFLVLTVLAGWCVACELVQPGHPLRWMLPMTIAMLPAFIDLMTAVNNDVLAIAVASVFLWLSVRLIRRGFDWLEFIGLSLLGILTYYVKNTAMVVLIAYPVTLLFSLLRGRWQKVAWIVLALALVAGTAVSLRWDDSFAWYRDTSQPGPGRLQTDQAVAGSHVFDVEAGAQVTPPKSPEFFQHLPGEVGKGLAGKWITFGYWIWSDQELRVRSPILRTVNKTTSENITLTKEPAFYAYQVLLPADTDRLWIYLAPEAPESSPAHIYYDGLVLAEGRRPVNEPPQFDTGDGQQGQWGGQPFQNILRNGSAELAGPRLSPWIDNLASRFLPDRARPSLLLASLVDAQGSQDLYPATVGHIFRTFWAKFGWGHVPLNGQNSYQILFFITLVGLLGALLGQFRAGRRAPWDVIVAFGLVVLAALLLALTRGGSYLAWPGYYYAPARHIFPVIIPIVLLFCCGWLEIFHLVNIVWQRLIHRQMVFWKPGIQIPPNLCIRFQCGLYLLFFLGLDLLSVISVAQYYSRIALK
jgi:hypothetical protein